MTYKNIWCPETQAISAIEAAQALCIVASTSEYSMGIGEDEKYRYIHDEFMMASERMMNILKDRLNIAETALKKV